MTDETDNPVEAGTDNVETSFDDTPESYDYFDPDEEQDTEEAVEEEGTDDEAGETEDNSEDAEAEQEPEETPEDQPEVAEVPLDGKLTLQDGTETTVEELVKGNMRQADYSRKSQEVANRRKEVEADASRIEGFTTALIDHLSNILPNAPDPSLIYTDPQKYTQEKAIHDNAFATIQQLMQVQSEAKQATDKMSKEDRQALIANEERMLIEAAPEVGTQAGRQEFFKQASETATELGFTNEELGTVTDHRLFMALKWAAKGMAAEKAKQSAKAKVAQAPKTAPRKPGKGANASKSNRDAMRQLMADDSIENAARLFAGS